jgi:hypothetical protein
MGGHSRSLSALPILCEFLWARFCWVLVMISIGKEASCIVVEGVSKDPVRGVIGDGVADPLDMVGELAFVMGLVVLRVDNTVDEVFRCTVNNKWWRGWLFAVLEGVAVLWFELRNVEDWMDANGARELKSE